MSHSIKAACANLPRAAVAFAVPPLLNCRARERRHRTFEPVTARNTSSSVDYYSLFHHTMSGSWEHDANRRPFKDVLDSWSVLGATQYQSTASVRALQALVRQMIPTDIRWTRKNRRVGNIKW